MKVVFRAGPRAGEEIEVERTLTIGRQATDLELEDAAVSRHHASLRPTEQGLTIEDLDSTNGTFVNGERISGSRALNPGDVVSIGASALEVVGDWRAAETQAISVPPRQPEGVLSDEEHRSTARLPLEQRRWNLSDIPLPWAIGGAAILALTLVALIMVLSNESPKDELVAAADEACKEAAVSVAGVRLNSTDVAEVRRQSGRLLETRQTLRARLAKLKSDDEVGRGFREFIERFVETNERLARLTELNPRAKGPAVRSAIDSVQASAAAEGRAAKTVGLEECGGLPV